MNNEQQASEQQISGIETSSKQEKPDSTDAKDANVGTVTGGLIGAAVGGLAGGRIGAAAGAAIGAVAGAVISGQNPLDRAKEAIDSVTGGQNPLDRAKEALDSATGGQNPLDRVKEAASNLKESVVGDAKQKDSFQEAKLEQVSPKQNEQPPEQFEPLAQTPGSDSAPQGETIESSQMSTQGKTPGVSNMVEAAYENAMEMEQPERKTPETDKPTQP